MAIQLLDSAGTNKMTIDAQGSARFIERHPNIGSNGAYILNARTGLLTVVAAGTASAGHVFAARWGASKYAIITKLAISWTTITGFTAAQEVGVEAFITRSFTVSHSGGTGATLTGNSLKKLQTQADTGFTDIRWSTTGALTNGTHTIDTHPILSCSVRELAAAATIQGFSCSDKYEPSTLSMFPLILSPNEGIIVRNIVLMGAGGTARVGVNMEWLEVDSY